MNRELCIVWGASGQYKVINEILRNEGYVNEYWLPATAASSCAIFDRSEILGRFSSLGIDCRVFFWPLSLTPIEGRKAFESSYLSESLHQWALNLPSYPDSKTEDCEMIANQLRHLIHQ